MTFAIFQEHRVQVKFHIGSSVQSQLKSQEILLQKLAKLDSKIYMEMKRAKNSPGYYQEQQILRFNITSVK